MAYIYTTITTTTDAIATAHDQLTLALASLTALLALLIYALIRLHTPSLPTLPAPILLPSILTLTALYAATGYHSITTAFPAAAICPSLAHGLALAAASVPPAAAALPVLVLALLTLGVWPAARRVAAAYAACRRTGLRAALRSVLGRTVSAAPAAASTGGEPEGGGGGGGDGVAAGESEVDAVEEEQDEAVRRHGRDVDAAEAEVAAGWYAEMQARVAEKEAEGVRLRSAERGGAGGEVGSTGEERERAGAGSAGDGEAGRASGSSRGIGFDLHGDLETAREIIGDLTGQKEHLQALYDKQAGEAQARIDRATAVGKREIERLQNQVARLKDGYGASATGGYNGHDESEARIEALEQKLAEEQANHDSTKSSWEDSKRKLESASTSAAALDAAVKDNEKKEAELFKSQVIVNKVFRGYQRVCETSIAKDAQLATQRDTLESAQARHKLEIERIADLEEEVDRLNEEIEEIENAKNEALDLQEKQYRQELDRKQYMINTVQENLIRNNRTHQEDMAKISELECKLEQHGQVTKKLQHYIDVRDNQLKVKDEKISTCRDEIKEWTERVNELKKTEKAVVAKDREISGLKNSATAKDKKIVDLEDSVATKGIELAASEGKIRALQKTDGEKEDRIAALEKDLACANTELDGTRKRADNAAKELEALKKIPLEDASEDSKARIAALDEAKSKAEEQLEQAREEFGKWYEKGTVKEKELRKQLRDEQGNARDQVAQKEKDVREEARAAWEREKERLQAEAEAHQRSLTSEIESLQKQRDQVEVQKGATLAALGQMREDLESNLQRRKEHEAMYDDAIKQRDSLQEERDLLTRAGAAAVKEIGYLRQNANVPMLEMQKRELGQLRSHLALAQNVIVYNADRPLEVPFAKTVEFRDFSTATGEVAARMHADPQAFFQSEAEFHTVGDMCVTALINWEYWLGHEEKRTKVLRSNYVFGPHAFAAGEREDDELDIIPFCYVLPLARAATRGFYFFHARKRDENFSSQVQRSWAAVHRLCHKAEEASEGAYLADVARLAQLGDPAAVLGRAYDDGSHRLFPELRVLEDNPLRRRELRGRPFEVAVRVRDYLTEIEAFLERLEAMSAERDWNYGSWREDVSWEWEVFGWRRVSSFMRHILETEKELLRMPLVAQVIKHWLEEGEILERYEKLAMKDGKRQKVVEGEKTDPGTGDIEESVPSDENRACFVAYEGNHSRLKLLEDRFVKNIPYSFHDYTYRHVDENPEVFEGEIIADLKRMAERYPTFDVDAWDAEMREREGSDWESEEPEAEMESGEDEGPLSRDDDEASEGDDGSQQE
ncbi:hypothetical protein GTA08_BOTSDO03908 [Neofusicoccum parvum]|uniref:Uncharacterized protein n=1 Tax=Neofusicoccum parvum TaxID=310453 RepID=A0ACB5S1J3_9PEZI|nr:hypothetical protein GTA08_BOTSDO03908 [Neofusicoccum parvum]